MVNAMRRGWARIAILSLLCVSGNELLAGEILKDEARGFTLTLPDGFVEAPPEFARLAPGTAHVFLRGDLTDDKPDVILTIQQLTGTIGRDRLKAKDVPPGFKGRLFTETWQGFESDAFEVPEELGSIKVVTYAAQIPLKPLAIQVHVSGPIELKTELKALLSETLKGLKGETSWTSPASSASLRASRHYGTILLVVAFAIVLGMLVIFWMISRSPETPRGTVLMLAVLFYVAAFALASIRVREIVMLRGILKLTGFAGLILGLIDFFRKGKKDEKPDTPKDAKPPE